MARDPWDVRARGEGTTTRHKGTTANKYQYRDRVRIAASRRGRRAKSKISVDGGAYTEQGDAQAAALSGDGL